MKIDKITVEQYPFLLRQIKPLPPTMDLAGTLPSDDNKFLCVIGSRLNSNYGEDACQKIIRGLEGYPIVIVSGLAIGIDSLAHYTALEVGLRVIAFPGSGLSDEVLYPRSRRDLARRILDSGNALLSPFESNQRGDIWTFPVRNRLMAGMSHATLIIEAARGSGTLITADYAAEFARDILAVPGSIFADLSYGPHMLIRRGATPITCANDVLEALGFIVNRKDGMTDALPNFAEMSLSDDQRMIVENLKREPLSSSSLIEKTLFSSSQFNATMSELELRGIIKESEGQYFLK